MNNNNQMSDSADAENMGNARQISTNFFCPFVRNEVAQNDNPPLETLMTSILGFILADFLPDFDHDHVVNIMENHWNYCPK